MSLLTWAVGHMAECMHQCHFWGAGGLPLEGLEMEVSHGFVTKPQ